jgi:hypothetical protein
MKPFPSFRLAAALLASGAACAAAAGEPSYAQRYSLPEWTQAQLEAEAFAARYLLDATLNPYLLHGDFDGDGRGDVVLLVRDRAQQRMGLAFVHQAGPAPHVVGAGHELGNGSDDFGWVDAWSLFPKGPASPGIEGPAPTLRGDALMIYRTESSSALLFWDGKRYQWHQQGD